MAAGATRGAAAAVALAPRLGKTYSRTPTFRWGFAGKAQTYRFVLLDDSLAEIFRESVSGTQYSYPANAPALEPGKTYFWTVEPVLALLSASPSSPVGFLVVGGEQRVALEQELQGSAGSASDGGLARARRFTEHRLWYDAIDAYSKLIERDPHRADLYQERGTIYAQLSATEELADQDFHKADQLRSRR